MKHFKTFESFVNEKNEYLNEDVKSDVQKLLSKVDDELYNIIKWKDAASCYVSAPADAADIIDAVKSKYPKSSWDPKTNLLVFESEELTEDLTDDELLEASLAGGKPQWRFGEYGDIRYSAGVQYTGGKVAVMAVPNGIRTGRYDNRRPGEYAEAGWGESYTVYSPVNAPYFNGTAEEITDFVNGLAMFVDAVGKTANSDLQKSKAGKDIGIEDAAPGKTKYVNVVFDTKSGSIFKPSTFKKLSEPEKTAVYDAGKIAISKAFSKAKDVVVSNEQLAFTVEY